MHKLRFHIFLPLLMYSGEAADGVEKMLKLWSSLPSQWCAFGKLIASSVSVSPCLQCLNFDSYPLGSFYNLYVSL